MAEAIAPTSPTDVGFKIGTGAEPPTLLGGTTYNVTGDLQTVMGGPTMKAGATPALNGDGTHRNNTYIVPAGSTHTGPLVIPGAVGTGWTRIISGGTLPARGVRVTLATASQMFKVVSLIHINAAAVSMSVPTQGWIFVGMEATSGGTLATYYTVFIDPTIEYEDGSKDLFPESMKRIIFDHCLTHPAAGQLENSHAMFIADGQDVQVWDSWSEGTSIQGGQSDSQGIFIRRGKRIHVENNELRGEECIHIGDQGSGTVTYDTVVARNHLLHPLSWFRYLMDGNTPNPQWDGIQHMMKNNFEIKAAVRCLCIGNHLENNPGVGSIPGDGQSDQDGAAWVINAGAIAPVNADIEARSNLIENCSSAFTISGGYAAPPGGPTERVKIYNNLAIKVGGRLAMLNYSSIDTWIEHNTVVPNDGVNVGRYPSSRGAIVLVGGAGSWPRLTLRRNVFGWWELGLYMSDAGTGLTTALADSMISNRDFLENAMYQHNYWGGLAGLTSYEGPSAAGINLVTGKLTSGPLKNASSESPPKDLGADHDALESAMGTPGPPVASFEPLQTMGTRTVVFQDTSV